MERQDPVFSGCEHGTQDLGAVNLKSRWIKIGT